MSAVPPPRDLSAHLKSATLSEFDSKSLLREAGIALPDEVLVTERDGLDAAIARVGFPLVMKIQSRDIPHKSEVGGVRVNIATKGEAFTAYRRAARQCAASIGPMPRSRACWSARWRKRASRSSSAR